MFLCCPCRGSEYADGMQACVYQASKRSALMGTEWTAPLGEYEQAESASALCQD